VARRARRQAFVHFREGDVILSTRPKEARGGASLSARAVHAAAVCDAALAPQGSPQRSGLALSSSLGKYSDEYTLTARASAARPAGAAKPVRASSLLGPPCLALCAQLTAAPTRRVCDQQAELRKSITTWFYEDGELAQEVLKRDVMKLLSAYERAQQGSRGKSE
jgi:hypothetical protein